MTEKQQQKAQRMADMVRMREAGVSHDAIAKCYGVSTKTVQRTLKASGQDGVPSSFRRLKPRQQRFVTGVIEGLSERKAALQAGYAPSTASSAGRDITENPAVQQAMRDLVRVAIPDELLLQRLREGLDAEETQFFAHQGHVISERRVVDLGMRARYIELAGRFGGTLKEAAAPEVTVPVQIVLDL